jgi:uncharacterized protein (DUF927 family)
LYNGKKAYEFLELFKNTFKGRDDVVAEHWEFYDKTEDIMRSGYRPICKNRKKKGICPKCSNYRSPCSDCESKDWIPLSGELLIQHFKGKKLLGVYPLLKDNTCQFIAGDFDNHDGKHSPYDDVKALSETCEVQQLPLYICRSKSGKGYHTYLFFDNPVSSWKARLVMFELIREAGLLGDDAKISQYDQERNNDDGLKDSSFDRLFPNQDELKSQYSIGNLIALEFYGKVVEKGNTIFLDPFTKLVDPYQDQIDVLKNIRRISESDLDKIIEEWDLKREQTVSPPKQNYKQVQNDQFEKLLKCDFIKWAYENQDKVEYELWRSMLSNVSRIDSGGPGLCHQCSKNDLKRYSPSDTNNMIIQVLDGSGPITCDHIQKNGFKCSKDCGVTSPIVLTHKNKIHRGNHKNININKAKESIEELLSFAQTKPKEVVSKILEDPSYISSLSLVAENEASFFEETMLKFGLAGVKTKDINSIKKIIKDKRKRQKQLIETSVASNADLLKVVDRLDGAPVDDTIVIPHGWDLSYESGVEKIHLKEGYDRKQYQEKLSVSPAPIIIVARLVNIQKETEAVKLAWYRDDAWKYHVVDRKIIAASRTITDLAAVGLPVTNVIANDLVKYLAEFEATNIKDLERLIVSDTMGWQKDRQGYLLGDDYYQCETDKTQNAPSIIFRAADEGNQQVADSFKTNGSYEKWIDIVNKIFDYPKAIAGIYFSLAVPFLELLGAPNFVVDWAYGTSKGKTTVLRIAGSCWGNPDELTRSSVVNTWDNTKYYIESTAALLNGLPLILDDTKLAGTGNHKNKAAGLVSHMIYLITNGRGRGKGSLSGIRRRKSWRIILLSNGENPAVEFTQDGGSRARVITLWGPPFGSGNNAQIVKDINLMVKQNYGHAGQKIIKYIFTNEDQWELWKNSYIDNQRQFSLKAGSNEIADRISGYFAVLATVIPLIHVALPELRNDPAVHTILDNLWNTATKEIDSADRPTAALRFVYNWAVSNQAKFWDKTQQNDEDREPYGGWAGVWEKENWQFIGFATQTVKQILEDEGFDVEGIIRTWKERGWLITGGSGRMKQHRLKGQHFWSYTIKKEAIAEAIGEDLKSNQNLALGSFINNMESKLYSKIPKDASAEELSILEKEFDQVLSSFFHNPAEGPVTQEPQPEPLFVLPWERENKDQSLH